MSLFSSIKEFFFNKEKVKLLPEKSLVVEKEKLPEKVWMVEKKVLPKKEEQSEKEITISERLRIQEEKFGHIVKILVDKGLDENILKNPQIVYLIKNRFANMNVTENNFSVTSEKDCKYIEYNKLNDNKLLNDRKTNDDAIEKLTIILKNAEVNENKEKNPLFITVEEIREKEIIKQKIFEKTVESRKYDKDTNMEVARAVEISILNKPGKGKEFNRVISNLLYRRLDNDIGKVNTYDILDRKNIICKGEMDILTVSNDLSTLDGINEKKNKIKFYGNSASEQRGHRRGMILQQISKSINSDGCMEYFNATESKESNER